MQRLEVKLGKRAYPILVGPGLLGSRELLARHAGAAKLLVVTDDVVGPAVDAEARGRPRRAATTTVCVLPGGEQQKTLGNVATHHRRAGRPRGINRDGMVLALGGGVIGDIAGFAAASYQRGIAIVQLPTTLLAQVDSSVGGKTGVNHPGGKNLIGAFHQPTAVIADTDTLSTLPDRQLRAGLAGDREGGARRGRRVLRLARSERPKRCSRASPRRSPRRSGAPARSRPRSSPRTSASRGRRALLNLGHTFGHAIEAGAGYGNVLHGEAVAAGLVLAAELSARIGRLPGADALRVRELLSSAGLPVDPPRLGRARMLELMGMDKKVKGGQVRLVLLDGIGRATVTADYPREALEALLEERAGA